MKRVSPLLRLLATASVAAAMAVVPAPAAAQSGCVDTDLLPSAANLDRIEQATLCLLNATRSEHDLGTFAKNGQLRQAALAHAQDMLARRYFSHDSPEGATVVDRVTQAGYLPRGTRWAVGENLAWATGQMTTPRAIHTGWMNSPGHRAAILTSDFEEVGIAAMVGVPLVPIGLGATYAANFGARVAGTGAKRQVSRSCRQGRRQARSGSKPRSRRGCSRPQRVTSGAR